MDSTLTLSPPTSRARAARSSVVVMTLSLPWAVATSGMSISSRPNANASVWRFMKHLERMRSVRTDGKLNLEQKFIGRWSDGPVGEPILPAHLAVLTRPVRQDGRPPAVAQLRVGGAVRAVESDAGEPAPSELILT